MKLKLFYNDVYLRYGAIMRKVFLTLSFMIITINASADERFSFQSKPLLWVIPFIQTYALPIIVAGETNVGDFPIIVDIEFKYKLNNNFSLSFNPVFAQGFWKYFSFDAPVGGIGGIYSIDDYYASNCLDFVFGVLYRPFGTGLRGLYIGAFPIIGWGYVTYGYGNSWIEANIDNGYDYSAVTKISDFLNLGFIIEIGYDWIFENGFSISLGAGITRLFQIPKVSIITAVNSPEIGNFYYNYGNLHGLHLVENMPIDPRLKFSIGYSF